MMKLFKALTVRDKLQTLLREAQMNAIAARVHQEEHEVLQQHERNKSAMYVRRAVWIQQELDRIDREEAPFEEVSVPAGLHVIGGM